MPEHDRPHPAAHGRRTEGAFSVSALTIYPLKSAAGLSLGEACVEARGLAQDRRWMLVDGDRRFLTQRSHPRMALIRVGLLPEGIVADGPGMETLRVPVPGPEAGRLRVKVWRDRVEAAPAGAAADAWFSRFLGLGCRLVYLPEDSVRRADPRYAPGEAQVSFADGFPLLLLSEGSLAALNGRLSDPVPMNRFRPNLVVSGCPPFAEDGWKQVRIGEVLFHIVKPCARCRVVTVDQETGEAAKEPLATLATFRKRGGKVLFGQNLVPAAPGTVRLGDPVTPLPAGADGTNPARHAGKRDKNG